MVGEGQEFSRLNSLARDLGIEQRVRFWGQIKNDLLPDFYAAADLLVAPASDTEGQGVVLAEAFAARLCVLATRAGGIEEVVEDGVAGMLVQPGDSQALARGIEKLLTHPELREALVENAFQRVRGECDWEKIAVRFETLYRRVLDKPQGPR